MCYRDSTRVFFKGRSACMNMDSHSYRNMHDKNPYKKMNCHSYRNVHDENTYTRKWIVICTKMCMTKTHKNIDIHSYRDVHDDNPYKNNMHRVWKSNKRLCCREEHVRPRIRIMGLRGQIILCASTNVYKLIFPPVSRSIWDRRTNSGFSESVRS